MLEQAAHWYVGIFGERAARHVDVGLDEPTWSKRLGVRLGGWVDLAVVDDTGTKELRQFELWNGRADLLARSTGHERVRAPGWRRLPYLFQLCARVGRTLGHVPVA